MGEESDNLESALEVNLSLLIYEVSKWDHVNLNPVSPCEPMLDQSSMFHAPFLSEILNKTRSIKLVGRWLSLVKQTLFRLLCKGSNH